MLFYYSSHEITASNPQNTTLCLLSKVHKTLEHVSPQNMVQISQNYIMKKTNVVKIYNCFIIIIIIIITLSYL